MFLDIITGKKNIKENVNINLNLE